MGAKMKLAWLTDIHLNFLDEDARNSFYQDILKLPCEALLITGDVAEAPSLTNQTILLGHDGWADGRLGDYTNSRVSLNDSRMIHDLFEAKMYGNFKLLDKMQELADADAVQLLRDIKQAAELKPKKIIVLTHVPPFREACQHLGGISGDDWLPYFASKAIGDVLIYAAESYRDIEFLVLCGHTHSDAVYEPLDNMTVKAGGAEYGRPGVQGVVEV